MRPLTYLAFTLLSVVIQFCVMDFIQEKLELEDENPIAYNETISYKQSMSMFRDNTNTLALYYRSNRNNGYEKIKEVGRKYSNSSLQNHSSLTTEVDFTVFDVLYDENVSTTDSAYTTESFLTTTDLDNVTEITLFEQKSSTVRPTVGTKKSRAEDMCYCNLLYKQCDINCCCDEECSLADKELFDKCKNFSQEKKRHPLACGETSTRAGFGNLLCIYKTNLPDQRAVIKQKVNEATINDVFLWHDNHKQESYTFNNNIYKAGAPVWILRNKCVYYLDLPASIVNNYCSVRRKMTFLDNEKIRCQVKFKDLEMFRVLKIVEESSVISVTNNSSNNTVMNCSSLHCTNWTIIYCDQDVCVAYNKSLHAPTCTESDCTNIALKIEYIFYIYESKIVNATLKLYAQKIKSTQYVSQDIYVKFYIGNASLERVVTLSGNPGYIAGLPVIASFAEENYTDNFFNGSTDDNYISYAENKGGFCVLTSIIKKDIRFGINRRTKCRISLRPSSTTNATEVCIGIQRDINKMAGASRKVYVSPYGNPENVKDDSWLQMELRTKFIHGEFLLKRSKLQCFNVHTRIAFVFTYADLSDTIGKAENKLFGVRVNGSATNVTFDAEAYTTVITIDVNFINAQSATRRELAGPPRLNLNLPNNFFFPFPPNVCSTSERNIFLILYSSVATLFVFK